VNAKSEDGVMAVWVVRAGRKGEREEFALENDQVVVGWDDLPDLSGIEDKDKLWELVDDKYPGEPMGKIRIWTGQLWSFLKRMQVGDMVALPLKESYSVAVGKVKGSYEYDKEREGWGKHYREVEWLNKDVPRDSFDQDIRFSLGTLLTVGQMRAENAESRIRTLLQRIQESGEAVSEEEYEPELPTDLERYSNDQILSFVSRKFAGHRFAYLVGSLLEAKGYEIDVSTPGPDGGVDIIAGRGPMGFDSPRMIVQVKSGGRRADVTVVRELSGVMRRFGADHVLVVSWAGFTSEARKEARQGFFEIRLWNAEDLVREIQEHYDKFAEEILLELPLKRIWTLTLEE